MTFEELLQAAAAELGLKSLEPDANGVAALEIDGETAIFLEKSPFDDARGYAYAVLGRIPDTNREEFYATLLEAQLFGSELGSGCSFGLARETGEMLLNQPFALPGADAEVFVQQLNEFVNWVQHWSSQISKGVTSNAPVSDGAPDYLVRI